MCVICLQPIDYDLVYPNPGSCSVQHLKSRKRFPELTWARSNWAPAHLRCNQAEPPDSVSSTSDFLTSWGGGDHA